MHEAEQVLCLRVQSNNIKGNINKKRVIFSNLKISQTTESLSKSTGFNQKSALYENKTIIFDHHQKFRRR